MGEYDWLQLAKNSAKFQAETFIKETKIVAEDLDVVYEWFLEEVLKNIHKIKDTYNRSDEL